MLTVNRKFSLFDPVGPENTPGAVMDQLLRALEGLLIETGPVENVIPPLNVVGPAILEMAVVPGLKVLFPVKALLLVREAGCVTTDTGAEAAWRAALISMVLEVQVAGMLAAQFMVILVVKQVTLSLKQMLNIHWVPVAPLPEAMAPLSAKEIGGITPELFVA